MSESSFIYLDYNATTPIDREVKEAMLPCLDSYFGNPSSSHQEGKKAKQAIENARTQVAKMLDCSEEEVLFTSGGTESNNYAIKGAALANEKRGKHIITSKIEHPAVVEVCKYLESRFGFSITYIDVDETGRIKLDELEKAITKETVLITIMHANNEVGTIQPIEEISQIARTHNILLHVDASQSVGKISTKVNKLGVDLLTIAGHKLYAPKGVGVLYIRKGVVLEKLMHGASHENNLRAGTENVIEIVGLGKACELVERDLEKNMDHMKKMRDLLFHEISKKFTVATDPSQLSSSPEAKLNGSLDNCLPNTLSVSFRNVKATQLIHDMRYEVALSAGAACHSEVVTVSHVLQAMGVPFDYAMGTLRFSTGKSTTEDEIHRALVIVEREVRKNLLSLKK